MEPATWYKSSLLVNWRLKLREYRNEEDWLYLDGRLLKHLILGGDLGRRDGIANWLVVLSNPEEPNGEDDETGPEHVPCEFGETTC